MEERLSLQRLCLVGPEYQVAELVFLSGERLFLLCPRQATADVQVRLTFVAAKIENFECTERLFCGFSSRWTPMRRCAWCGCQIAEIGGDPLAAQSLGYSGGSARSNEEIRD